MSGEIDIAPDFSVYRLVARARENITMVRHRRTMTIISHEIENANLLDRAQTVIFAGFQRFSKFLPQITRYRGIAQHTEAVYVFGVPDVIPPAIPNITYVPLKPADQLVKEWFLVSYGTTYFSALATEELTSIDDPDDQRQFKGLWTFDADIVAILYDWLASTVGRRGIDSTMMAHNYQLQTALMSSTIRRLTARLDQVTVDQVGLR